jgi:ribosomal protein L37E
MKKPIETNTLARHPFHLSGKFVKDAENSTIITCVEDSTCLLFSQDEVEKDGHFMCPKCGRLGQRMIEATAKQCGFAKPLETIKTTRYKAQKKWRRKWQTQGGDSEQLTLGCAKNVIERARKFDVNFNVKNWRIVQVDIYETPLTLTAEQCGL